MSQQHTESVSAEPLHNNNEPPEQSAAAAVDVATGDALGESKSPASDELDINSDESDSLLIYAAVHVPNGDCVYNKLGEFVNKHYKPPIEEHQYVLIGVYSLSHVSAKFHIMLEGLFLTKRANELQTCRRTVSWRDVSKIYLFECVKQMRNINDFFDCSDVLYERLACKYLSLPANYLLYENDCVVQYKRPQQYHRDGREVPQLLGKPFIVKITKKMPHVRVGDKTPEYEVIRHNHGPNTTLRYQVHESCLRPVGESVQDWDTSFVGMELYELDRMPLAASPYAKDCSLSYDSLSSYHRSESAYFRKKESFYALSVMSGDTESYLFTSCKRQVVRVFKNHMNALPAGRHNFLHVYEERSVKKLLKVGLRIQCNELECLINKVMNNNNNTEPEEDIKVWHSLSMMWVSVSSLEKFVEYFDVKEFDLYCQRSANTYVEIIIDNDNPLDFIWFREQEFMGVSKCSFVTKIVSTSSGTAQLQYLKGIHNVLPPPPPIPDESDESGDGDNVDNGSADELDNDGDIEVQ